ncbi:unnamed protein product [Angiostrongylus costaricensis]|uniref:Sulfate_transp domain-containing protein n=1 Tax=Angiostrongylus costaricensis TaxID=334426 RepID=A0A158PJQ8_ANGCS|nr:unnamed protein product [Angiostrongylus costaricensis]
MKNLSRRCLLTLDGCSVVAIQYDAHFWQLCILQPSEDFDKRFQYELPKDKASAWRKMMAITTKYWRPFTSPHNLASTIVSFMPILHWLPKYKIKSNLLHDIIGGLTVGIMHVPQGTFAVVALMTGKAVHRITAVDSLSSDHLTNLTASAIEHTPIQITSTLTVLIGLIQVLTAFLGLNFVTTYFSDELVGGFTTGASTHVFVTQLKDVLGISGLPRRYGLANLFLAITEDFNAKIGPRRTSEERHIRIKGFEWNEHGAHGNSQFQRPFSGGYGNLPVVILGTIISSLAHLNVNFNVAVVGRLPIGLPEPALPHFELFPSLFVDALSISVVTMAIHVSLAKIFAKKYQYEVNTNQEFYAVGFTSVLSGFFPIFPPSCSLSRSMVSAGAGAKSQVALLF